MLDNLKLAINATGTAGTQYSTGTVAHPDVIATTNTDTAQTIRSRSIGTAAQTTVINAIATTETLANTTWADTTLGGGTGASNPAVTTDAATFTIGDYGSVSVNTQGVAVAKDATTVTVRGRVPGTSLNTVAMTSTAVRKVWAHTTLEG